MSPRLGYVDLHRLLRRCSQADRKQVMDLILRLDAAVNREDTELKDLRVVVKDQANHIRNLEAQLMPYLKAPEGKQEAML